MKLPIILLLLSTTCHAQQYNDTLYSPHRDGTVDTIIFNPNRPDLNKPKQHLKTFCTLGIHGGLSLSYFGQGDKTYTGMRLATVGVNMGFYEDINISQRLALHAELNYLKLGSKNPLEAPENFNTYHIQLPLSLQLKTGFFSFQVGGYLNRLIYAKNYTWYGVNTFGWSVEKWTYYRHWTYGLTGGIGYNFQPVTLMITGLHSFSNIRNESFNNRRSWGNKDRALMVGLYLPFTFKNN